MCISLLLLREGYVVKTQIESSSSEVSIETGAVEQVRSSNGSEIHHHPAYDRLVQREAECMTNSASIEQPCSIETVPGEDDGPFHEGLRYVLAETAYRSVASNGSLNEIQSLIEAGSGVSLLIVEAGQDFAATCERIRFIKEQSPAIRVVMLVEHYDFEQMLAAIDAGAAAYLMRSTPQEVLIKILDLVMMGETILPITFSMPLRELIALPNGSTLRGLTKRETAILECLTEGASNKVIARKLEIAESTVKVYIKAILRKLQVKNRTQAAVWAFTHVVKREP